MEYTQFIDGELTSNSNRESWINYNPANNKALGEVCQANEQEIEAAVDSSEKAFNIWRTKTGAERGRVLIKAADILRSKLEKIALLETEDVGKPIAESVAVDITSAADALEYFGGMAAGVHGQFFDHLIRNRIRVNAECAAHDTFNIAVLRLYSVQDILIRRIRCTFKPVYLCYLKFGGV